MKKLLGALALIIIFPTSVCLAQTSYFQQDVRYTIDVRLDDQGHFLHGFEKFKYTNNSPENLDRLYIHLWPNAYRDNSSAFAKQKLQEKSLRFHNAPDKDRGYIDSLDFQVNGQKVAWKEWNGNPDVAEVILPQALAPGQSLDFQTPFRVKIPETFSRLGHIGQQYQLCQWYPKPAVFDRKGWHPMPYLDQGEFYSEYGTFDVRITLPKNYVVGATGDLPAGDPEWQWLEEREEKSRKLLNVKLSDAFFSPEFPEDEMKTLHFHQENVHDFAWFCDKNYYVLSQKVKLPESGREVRCVSMFTNLDRQYWSRGPEYVAKAVYYYSKMNGDYPYNHATSVDGALSAGAGMEYPNITVLGAGGSAENLEMVTMHEVGHNWYYGILGSNERAHPWMDEGLNTYFEGKYWLEYHGDTLNMIPAAIQERLGINFTHHFMGLEFYKLSASTGEDQPIEGAAADFTGMNYGSIVYMKTGLAFNYLEGYLGPEMTDKCFHAYFQKWKFKHPYPEDIQALFEEVSGKDLNWFFEGYLNGSQKLDFRIKGREGNTFTLTNHSGIALPVSLTLYDENGKAIKTYWTEPFEKVTTLTVEGASFAGARLNADDAIPEFKPENNFYKTKGLCKHSRPISLDFLYKFPSAEKYHIGLLPSIGFNTTDGFMGGLMLYHNFFPEKGFSWHLNPMFGFKSSHFVGSAGFTKRWLPNNTFRKIELAGKASSYSTFLRIKPSLYFFLKKERERSPFDHSFGIESQILADRPAEGSLSPDNWYLPVYGSFNWNTHAETVFSDFSLDLELGGNVAEQCYRGSLTTQYSRRLSKKMRASIRGFAGLAQSPDGAAPYLLQYRLSGSNDPFGEQPLVDRAVNSNWLSHQLTRDHGNFGSLTGVSAEKGLFALNASLRSPIKFLHLFGDFAHVMNTQAVGNYNYYDAGLRLVIMNDLLQVNVPLAGSIYGGLPSDAKDIWRGINFSFEPIKVFGNLNNLINMGGN